MTDDRAGEVPSNWPDKLREAAKWFDTIDRLLAVAVIEDNETGDVKRLVDEVGSGTQIQDDLRQLALCLEGECLLDGHDCVVLRG